MTKTETKPKSERQKKKEERQKMKEDLMAYVCDDLCKHTSKKEAALIKQCNKCKVQSYLEALK